MSHVVCIRCETILLNIMDEKKGHQPNDGLAFHSLGHYGSTVFDPMNGSYIEISLCDQCVSYAAERGWIYNGKLVSSLSKEGKE